jgi:Peptidase A4 family
VRLVGLGTIAATVAFAAPAGAATPSSNWAGYVAVPASAAAARFSSVSGSWTQPTASCATHRETYSAVWVGLGGDSERAQALEQIGTDADCGRSGNASYSSWYELVPSAPINLKLRVHPGDEMTASVTVRAHDVTLRLRDLSTGERYAVTRRVAQIDRSSAEWIVEAPSVCMSVDSCSTLALTDFADVAFSSATATAQGHTGELGDPSWSAGALELRQSATAGRGERRAAPRATATSLILATPSAVANGDGAFSVTFSEQSIQAEAPAPTTTLPGFGGGPP